MTDMTDMTARSLKFTYTNWKGETSERWATPLSLRWGATKWHPKAGWLMLAFDHNKGAEREFALSDCDFARTAPSVTVKPLEWDETDTGYKFQDYIGVYEVYLNVEGTWTFDSGEAVSAHASKEAAMKAGGNEHKRRILSAMGLDQ